MGSLIREVKDQLFSGFALGSGIGVIGFLVLGLTLVFVKGFHAISWRFLLTPMREGGIAGGILYQVLGTVILVLTTLVIVTPISIGVALVRSVCLRRPVLKRFFALFLYTLNAMPSILFGIFGFFFFVKYLGWGKSWLTGGILLSMMILPVTSLSLSEGMDRIPKDYTENALSLGLTRTALIHAVLLPQSFSGFVSGVLLGLARAAGETAPIMFTAAIFSGATFPKAIQDSPVLALPYHILNLAQETYQPQALENAWASALVLIAGVIILSLCALPFRIRLHEEAKS